MTTLLFVVFFGLMLLGVPIAFSTAIASAVFILNSRVPNLVVAQRMFVASDSFSLMAIPLFILAGEFMNSSGVTRRIVRFSNAVVGHITGGLAHITILASMLFAGMSGSSGAAASSVGAMMIPAMKMKGYAPEFAAVVTAAGSVIGPIIPPSIAMVMYCSITGYSTGKVFLGGIAPGVLIGLLLMVVAYVQCKKRGFTATKKVPFQEVIDSFLGSISAMLMPLIIIGGILSGVFTATEAGAVGAFYGLLIGFVYKEVKLTDLPQILINTGKTTAKVMFVISSAMLFGWILASVQFTQKLTAWLFSISSDPTAVFFLILGFLFVLGCFMVDAAIITLCTPLFIPIIKQTGIDPIQFGVVMCMMTTTGGITPPVGNLLFIACGIGNVSFVKSMKYLMPFLLALLAAIVICTLCPPIVTFIPNLVLGE